MEIVTLVMKNQLYWKLEPVEIDNWVIWRFGLNRRLDITQWFTVIENRLSVVTTLAQYKSKARELY